MKQLTNNWTTPEQAERLLKLGLPELSSDMYYWGGDKDPHVRGTSENCWIIKGCTPCWSVGRLLEISEICSNIGYFPYAWRIETIITDFSLRKFDFSKLKEYDRVDK